MLFSNLLFAVALTVLWPLGMLGLLAFCDWLERRTLVEEDVSPRRSRRGEGRPPEDVEAMVDAETSELVAGSWSAPAQPHVGTAPSNGRQPAPPPEGAAAAPAPPRAAPGRMARLARRARGRHERR
jgi:hypothetical protein